MCGEVVVEWIIYDIPHGWQSGGLGGRWCSICFEDKLYIWTRDGIYGHDGVSYIDNEIYDACYGMIRCDLVPIGG